MAKIAQCPLPLPCQEAPPRLLGIARLATLGESLEAGHNVQFHTIPTKTLLNRCPAKSRMPFRWTINPYRGCEFACKYCYARYTFEYMQREPLDFERNIYVKDSSAWLLRRELKKVKAAEPIAIGTATDPYQPAERRHLITRSILEVLAEGEGREIGIVTKSNLILRDLDLLQEIAARNALRVHLTVTTTDAALARKLEPRAPRPDLRLEAVRRLRQHQIDAGIICAPVLPGITDAPRQLEAVAVAAKEHDANFFFSNPVYLRPCSLAVFMPFLREQFPHLVARYEREYDGKKVYASKAYEHEIRSRVHELCRKHGLFKRDERSDPFTEPVRALAAPQLELFAAEAMPPASPTATYC